MINKIKILKTFIALATLTNIPSSFVEVNFLFLIQPMKESIFTAIYNPTTFANSEIPVI